jgi:hypothetical protein
MKKQTLTNNPFILLLLLITLIAFLRIFITIPNVTPIAAIALFGGTYIKRKELAILLPLIILFISDLFIGTYSLLLMTGVYTSFVIISLLGFILRKKINYATVIGSSIISSIIFFILTNFVVWAEGIWYPLNTQGLITCYIRAIPFFKNELIGTLAFTTFFFASYNFVTKKALSFKKA